MPGTERVGARIARADLPVVDATIRSLVDYLERSTHDRADLRASVTSTLERLIRERKRLVWALDHEGWEGTREEHGTLASYQARRCRCVPCVSARRNYDAARRRVGI